MLLAKWILFLVIGRIVIHVWQEFRLPDSLEKHKWIKKLHVCDLCGGVWIYTILSFFMGVDLLGALLFTYVPIVSEVVTGILISWLTHIFIMGWKARYEIVVV